MKDVILVTGGNGLVGQAIQRALQIDGIPKNEEWHFVGSKDGNLCDMNETIALFEKYKPTKVIHLAAHVGGYFYDVPKQLEFLRCNLMMVLNLLQVCTERKVKKVVSYLSSCIFPDVDQLPFSENSIYNGPPHLANFGYSSAKRMIDVINKAYHNRLGCKYTSIIPCNIFGPHDKFNPVIGTIVPSLIGKLYRLIETEGNNPTSTFQILGTGTPLRQFIYSLDIARLTIWALRNYDEVEPLMCCDDIKNEITIKEMAEKIAKCYNFKGNISFDVSVADGKPAKTASNEKLRRYLPDFKFTPLDEALQGTVDWYKENVTTARN